MNKFVETTKKPFVIAIIAGILYLIDALIAGLFVKNSSFMWVAFAFWTLFFSVNFKDRVKALIGTIIGFFAAVLMMLITNLKPENEEFTKIVNKVYIKRWKIEEYFRFKKQQFGFEKELVRTLNSIRTLNVLLTIIIGFIAMFSDNQKQIQYIVVFEASESIRKNKDIVFVYYAVARGMKKIFNFNLNGIKNKKEKGRKQKDMQISWF